jgi:hypothetical protein
MPELLRVCTQNDRGGYCGIVFHNFWARILNLFLLQSVGRYTAFPYLKFTITGFPAVPGIIPLVPPFNMALTKRVQGRTLFVVYS